MKRFSLLWLFLVAFTLLAAATAQLAPLPDDARFDQEVALRTQPGGESLPALIDALARTVGLTPIVDHIEDRRVSYNIDDPKPFRQLWQLVLIQFELDYVLLDNDVVVVGSPSFVARLKRQQAPAATEMADEAAVQRFYRVRNNPEDLAEVLRQAIPGVQVEVLANLSTLSVRGSEQDHQEVERILARFDTEIARSVRRVYTLSNAQAEALRGVLEQTVLRDMPDEDGAQVRLEDITIGADARTNSLIVTAPEVIQSEIADLIVQLDVPQPQVNVQVRIQEIQTTTAANLGINLSAGVGNFATTLLDSGLRFIFDAQNAITGLNIGAVLDTLERQGLSRRVDDSNLTMLNNGTGRINSGGRIELTFPSQSGEIQQRTLEFGVIIEITPRISADGRVILEISAEVSDLLVPLADGGIPTRIDFATREVTSTVTLEPGQTVLLGGLLQNSFSTTTQGVPLLSSIPILGELFKTTRTSEESTELLLIVNAMVIN
jgi:type IV pilus assembly protein PilQ